LNFAFLVFELLAPPLVCVSTAIRTANGFETRLMNAADAILSSNQSLDLLIKDAGKLWFKIEALAEAKRKEGN
jgi:hypothetical protein